MPKLDYSYVMEHIDEFPCLGDIYDDKGKIKFEFHHFISHFGEINLIELLPIDDLYERKASICYYLREDNIYTITDFKEQKLKDLIRCISLKPHSQHQFSAIKHFDRTILQKFYIGCSIEKPHKPIINNQDLNEVWDSLDDDDFIRLYDTIVPKIVKLNQE